jgi:hypothetical protein
VKHLARALHCTEGHAYTAVIAGALLAAMAVLGVPPLLRADTPASRATTSASLPRSGAGADTTPSIPRFGDAPSVATTVSIPRYGEQPGPTTTTSTSAADPAPTAGSAQ